MRTLEPQSSVAMQPAAPWSLDGLTALGEWYLIERHLYPETSSGGIYLPDRYRDNWTQGTVLKTGPGRLTANGYSTMWADPGDQVLYCQPAWHHAGDPKHMHGFVRDSDLVAIWVNERAEPMNDWVLVKQEPDIEKASEHIIYAEEDRPKPMVGRVMDHGPGKIRWRGPLQGTRRSIPEVIGFPHLNHIKGARVWWSTECEMLSIGREELEGVLIAAGDLLLMEVADAK